MSSALALAAASTAGEQVAFWIVGPLAVLGGLMMVLSRRAVHSALWLAMTMMCLAAMFVMQGAIFLGVVQVVVYTGAVMMLFLFVLMLVGVDASDSVVETLRGQRAAAVLAGLGLGILLVGAAGRVTIGSSVGVIGAEEADAGNVPAIAHLIFTRYVWAFEVTSALLITAAVGAMVLAHRERVFRRRSQREQSVARTHSGFPQPLTSPGVYARHNAVDTPGLLPDGTPARVSVPAVLGGGERETAGGVPDHVPTADELEAGGEGP